MFDIFLVFCFIFKGRFKFFLIGIDCLALNFEDVHDVHAVPLPL
jgi:hypothetical protein